MENIFFENWATIARTLIIGTLAYASLILLLRISGKRTLSKMNAFDLIITVALGSSLATVLLNKDVTLAEGVIGFAVLIFLQFIVTWLSVRSNMVKSYIKSEPTLLFYKGEYLIGAMVSERITKDEIMATAREKGSGGMNTLDAVILETDGSMSAINKITHKESILGTVNLSDTD
ncbi:MAG: YetF domain-containing protein [Balneolales bacterium]